MRTLSCHVSGLELRRVICSLRRVEAAADKKHLRFGRPRLLQPARRYCVLRQEGFVSAYSRDALMPLWSSFTVDAPVQDGAPHTSPHPRRPKLRRVSSLLQTHLDPLPPLMSDCLRADVRVPPLQSPTCDQYEAAGNLTHAFLYPPSEQDPLSDF